MGVRALAFAAVLVLAAAGVACDDDDATTGKPNATGTAASVRRATLEAPATATYESVIATLHAEQTEMPFWTVTPTPIEKVVAATPPPVREASDGDTPSGGICPGPVEGDTATIVLGGAVPQPRCIQVTAGQRLRVENVRVNTVTVVFGLFETDIPPHEARILDLPFGEYLEPGMHGLEMDFQSFGEVKLLE